MKLKGLVLSVPVCDLRPLLSPDARRRNLSPFAAVAAEALKDAKQTTVKPTFIMGFGNAEERSATVPWRRNADTVFFDCSRAISLPARMPDDEPVERVVRRVYLDEKALVRFEFMLFANARHHRVSRDGRLDEFARWFWECEVQIRQWHTKSHHPLWSAIPLLVDKFAAMTSPFRSCADGLVTALEPQLQIIAEGSREELRRLDPEPLETGQPDPLFLTFRRLKMNDSPAPVDTAYITHLPGSFTRPGRDEYWPLSETRRQIAWLHADLQLLVYLVRRCLLNRLDPYLVLDYLEKLANGLKTASTWDDAESQIVSQLTGLVERFRRNRLSRMLGTLESSSLPPIIKARVEQALVKPLASSTLNTLFDVVHDTRLHITSEGDFIKVIDGLVAAFKLSVEENRGWNLLWNEDSTHRKEEAAQDLFLQSARHYCEANNIDISREPDIGRGPVDFKTSQGYSLRALLEVKLAKNTRFWHGLEKQLPKYQDAETVKLGYFLVIIFSDDDLKKLDEIDDRVAKVNKKTGYKITAVSIDARQRPPSASKL